MRDFDAVRARLGAEQVNLWGGSYGTRAALEYMRQFPQHVRSAGARRRRAGRHGGAGRVFAIDADAALAALVEACTADERCHDRYPDSDRRVDELLARADQGIDIQVRIR